MSETEKYDKAILQRLFPEISLTDKLVGQGGHSVVYSLLLQCRSKLYEEKS